MGHRRIIKSFLQQYAPRKEVSGQGKDRCLLLVSSTSGFGNASKLAAQVAQHLSQSFQTVTVIPTQRSEHVYDIMNTETLSEYEIAIILGGDGAFSEAVNGMLKRPDGQSLTLAHCPGGSGCSTSGNTIGVWKGEDIAKACDIISNRKVGKMDVIEVQTPGNDKNLFYSISCVSGGMYTDIIDLADKYYKWTYYLFGPTARYIFGVIHAFIKYGKRDNNRIARYIINDGEEVVECSTMGFAVYNDGRVMEHARYANATVGNGSLSLALDKAYMGLGAQLKYVGDLAKEKKLDGEAAENRFVRDDITSIRVEPIDAREDSADGKTLPSRPLTYFLDGEKGRGNKDFMVAPFSARVLPEKLDVIVS